MIDFIINTIQAFITFWALFLTGACVTIWGLYHSFKSGGKYYINKQMKDKISVTARFETGFGLELVQLYLKNETGTIEISKSQWQEIQAVINGKREKGFSEELNGYTPKTAIFWNK